MEKTISISKEKINYTVDFQGEYIDLKVTGRNGEIINKYTVDNDGDMFSEWCVRNNHAAPQHEKEFDPDDATAYSISYNTTHCKEDADLVLEYCLEQIANDFPPRRPKFVSPVSIDKVVKPLEPRGGYYAIYDGVDLVKMIYLDEPDAEESAKAFARDLVPTTRTAVSF